jgi:hypothetical protein
MGLAVGRATTLATLLTAVVAAVIVVRVVPTVRLIAALAIYLPLEGFILSALPQSLVPTVRYLPEFAAAAGAGWIIATRGFAVLERIRFAWAPLGALAAATVASTVINGADNLQALIGVRAELRFFALAVIAAASAEPLRDAGIIARAVVWSGLLQCAIGLLEFFGGEPVRHFFAPTYSIAIGGVDVFDPSLYRPGTLFGTLGHYNQFAAVLITALVVSLAAGPQVIGMSRRAWLAVNGTFAALVLMSGSREGLIALLIVLAVFTAASRRRILLSAAAAALGLVFLVGPPVQNGALANQSRSVVNRFAAFADPTTYSFSSGNDFRLSLLATEFDIARHRGILLGAGPGSIVDPRTATNGTNPLYDTAIGTTAVDSGFQYDGNWGLILVEFGAIGVAAFALLLYKTLRLGRRSSVWTGRATVALTVVVLLLGFFSSILQTRDPTAVLWLLAGYTAAVAAVGTGTRASDDQ